MSKSTTAPKGGVPSTESRVPSYRALVGLNYPTAPDIIARLLRGENVPFEERGERRVEAGEIVSDIPAASIPWLLEAGEIEEVAADG